MVLLLVVPYNYKPLYQHHLELQLFYQQMQPVITDEEDEQ